MCIFLYNRVSYFFLTDIMIFRHEFLIKDHKMPAVLGEMTIKMRLHEQNVAFVPVGFVFMRMCYS